MAAMDNWARVLDDADPETAALIISLQIQEMDALAQDAATSADSAMARDLFTRDIADYCAIREIAVPETPPQPPLAGQEVQAPPTEADHEQGADVALPLEQDAAVLTAEEPSAKVDNLGEEAAAGMVSEQCTVNSSNEEPAADELRLARLAASEGPQALAITALDNDSGDNQDAPTSANEGLTRSRSSSTWSTASQSPSLWSESIFAIPGNLLNVVSTLGQRRYEDEVVTSGSKQQEMPPKPQLTECRSCTELVEDAYTGPCQHSYCADCVEHLFQLAMKDETSYPPRCCRQPFLIDQVKRHLDENLFEEFIDKREELEDRNKLYCHEPSCSAYIPQDDRHDRELECGMVGICPSESCGSWTCMACKGSYHTGRCSDDEGTKLVLEIAKEEGWQRCEPCGRMLELTVGCYHMTCICKAEFCYKCAAPWKTCVCPQWDERRLIAQADRMVRRQGLNPADAGAVAAHLRVHHHNCATEGHDWEFEPGRHDCARCGETLYRFINECRHCNLRVCNRCQDRE